MKKLYLTLLLFSFALRAIAPNNDSLVIIESSVVNPFSKLIYAVGMVEGMGDTTAYNPQEKAIGYFQIRPIRLVDYNRRTGNHYAMKDMFNYEISEKVFLYYASQTGPYNFEKIAKNWNGSGAKTALYWKRIKKYLI
jgi:hypothetical protein